MLFFEKTSFTHIKEFTLRNVFVTLEALNCGRGHHGVSLGKGFWSSEHVVNRD